MISLFCFLLIRAVLRTRHLLLSKASATPSRCHTGSLRTTSDTSQKFLVINRRHRLTCQPVILKPAKGPMGIDVLQFGTSGTWLSFQILFHIAFTRSSDI